MTYQPGRDNIQVSKGATVLTWPGLSDRAKRDKLAVLAHHMRKAGADRTTVTRRLAETAANMARGLQAQKGNQIVDTETLQIYVAAGSTRPETVAENCYNVTDCRDTDRGHDVPKVQTMRRTVKKGRHHAVKRAHRWPYGHGRTW